MPLWRLSPVISCLQAGGPRKLVVIVLVQVQKRGNWGADGVSPSSSIGEDQCSSSSCQAESQFFPSFCSLRALIGLDEAHPHWGEHLL